MRRFLTNLVGITVTVAAVLWMALDWYEEKRGITHGR